MTYNTKQKEEILNVFKENKNKSISAKDIIHILNNKVSKPTLYRALDSFYEKGIINKYFNETTNSYEYQYLDKPNECHYHLHFKCLKCGKIIHLHDVKIDKNLDVDYSMSIIYGLCPNCKK